MDNGKFILFGEDKKTLSIIKNALIANGYVYTGYSKEPINILRHIRSLTPDLVVFEINNNFRELRSIFDVIDEELLAACILVIDSKSDDIFEYLKNSRVMTYISKPVFDEVIIQIADLALMNYRRVHDYESKVRQLNETLESRKVIEKAKWILVQKQNLSENDAYELIRKKSRDNRIPMKDVANAIILANI